jgi:hypothetical protein
MKLNGMTVRDVGKAPSPGIFAYAIRIRGRLQLLWDSRAMNEIGGSDRQRGAIRKQGCKECLKRRVAIFNYSYAYASRILRRLIA